MALQRTIYFLGSPRVALGNPLSYFWPKQLQKQKHLELDEDTQALSSTSYFNSISQQKLPEAFQSSAQSLKIMVTKLFIVTNLSAACTFVAGYTI